MGSIGLAATTPPHDDRGMDVLGPVDTSRGLTTEQARAGLASHGPNVLPTAERPGLGFRLLRELREPMALLLVVAAGLSGLLLGEVVDAVAILVIVVVNATIALVLEGRAERALESLQTLEAPTATVVRDGVRRVIDAAELVPDDLVVLQAGDRVPADLVVLHSDGVEVDEAVLTGESLPVPKVVGGRTDTAAAGDRDGLLHSGTMVTRGGALGQVRATGRATALGAIAQQLRDVRSEPTPLQRQLDGLTRRLGTAAVVIAATAFGLALVVVDGLGVEGAFLTAVALSVAAVPEGLAAVTTVALALGVGRMAERGAIVRRLSAVETLGATDVLVIDKTGTVTENRMQLTAVIGYDGTVWDAAVAPTHVLDAVRPVLLLCNDATIEPPTGDPTERALLDLTTVAELDTIRGRHPRLGVAPFDSDRKRMSTMHLLDGTRTVLVKGAPESVLPLGIAVLDTGTGSTRPLDDAGREVLASAADGLAAGGQRVLALARREAGGVPTDIASLERGLTIVGLVALRDPPRASAAGSVAAIRSAGMSLVMATGDHPGTATAVAAEIGLGHGPAMTGAALRAEGVPADPLVVRIYARVDPDQKLAIVSALQEGGHTVAMTGDGVNDAPALRRADIGVALGETGSDVAREVADLVVTDDDLATIVAAVREGRGIHDNIRKVIDYLVTSNFAEVMIVIGSLLLVPALGVPLFPLQLLWINLLTDGLPALALGVDPVDPALMGRPPRRADHRLLDRPHLRVLGERAAVLAVVALGTLWVALEVLGMRAAEARTVLFSTVVLSQVMLAFVVRRSIGPVHGESNRWLWWSAAGSLAAQAFVMVVPTARTVFDTVPLSADGWVLLGVGGLIGPGILAARAAWVRRRLRRSGPPTG